MRSKRAIRNLFFNLWQDHRASALPMFAAAALPMVYLTGMGIDYSLATQRQAKLNALADAAAKNIFNAQATKMSGVNYDPTKLSVTITDNGPQRTVNVSYQATSQNMLPAVPGFATIALQGSSQSNTSLPPNIDFYLLLDNSPSMAIAATTGGINTMVANTQPQGGCAFACHESAPQLENGGKGLQNKNLAGKVDNTVDNYQLANNLGVVTRIANLRPATQNLGR